MRRAIALAMLSLMAATALAAPHRPLDDGLVLERLPGGASASTLADLRRAAAAAPAAADRTRALASEYLALGRRQAEPRLVAYAGTVMEPLLGGDRPAPDDLVLAATAAQYLHDFDRALALLDRALAIQPLHPQALLTRADLREVRGDFAPARADCARLAQVGSPLVAIACLTSIDSRSGRLAESLERLRTAYEASPGLPADVEVWLLASLADMAERSGDGEAQGRYLERARQRAPEDPKVGAAWTDWALRRHEDAKVLAVMAPAAAGDPVLLRLAIAARGANDPRAARWAGEFRERQRLAVGDARHLREWARFALDFDRDSATALRWARENWAHQREPEDLRLLVQAATAAGDASTLADARAWMAAHRYEDRTLP